MSQQNNDQGEANPEEAADNSLSKVVAYNTFLLSGSVAALYGMGQLVLAIAAITFVSISGIHSLAGIAPAIFMLCGSIAAMVAGRTMDRLPGRKPVLAAGFFMGIVGALITAYAISIHSIVILIAGFMLMGFSFGTSFLSRVAAADMYQPERRGWGISLVLFGAVFGALLGPMVFMPLFHGNAGTLSITPWFAAAGFMLIGLVLILLVRPDPRRIAELISVSDAAGTRIDQGKARLVDILQRPGIAIALFVAVISYTTMVVVMSVSSLLMISHGHSQESIFPVLSAHFLGMFGLVLFIGKFIERIGKKQAMIGGLIIIAVSALALMMVSNMIITMIALFGVGLGWSMAFVASNTELATLTTPGERGSIVGLTDLLSGISGAGLTILGGILFAKAGLGAFSIAVAVLALLPLYSLFRRSRPAKVQI